MTTKHLEPLSWVAPVLGDNAKTHIFIYETGAGVPLPRAVAQHPRVTLRTKPPERDPFFSFFDHAARNSGGGDYTLFVHGHDTHYHRQTPTRRLVALCYEAAARATFAYANAGDAVHSTWAGCAHAASRAACVEAPPCASMVALINSSWTAALGALVGDARPPARVAEINGNEALVHRCRLAARPAREWAALRDLTETHHGGLAFALGGLLPSADGRAVGAARRHRRRPQLCGVRAERGRHAVARDGAAAGALVRRAVERAHRARAARREGMRVGAVTSGDLLRTVL